MEWAVIGDPKEVALELAIKLTLVSFRGCY